MTQRAAEHARVRFVTGRRGAGRQADDYLVIEPLREPAVELGPVVDVHPELVDVKQRAGAEPALELTGRDDHSPGRRRIDRRRCGAAQDHGGDDNPAQPAEDAIYTSMLLD